MISTSLATIQEYEAHPSFDLSQVTRGCEPVILRGLISHWPLVKLGKQSDVKACEYLQSFYNDLTVQAFEADAKYMGRYFYNEHLDGFNFKPTFTTLNDIIAHILQATNQSTSIYMGSTSIDHILPGLRKENPLPQLDDKPLINIWLGSPSRIAAHFDIPNNIACVALGKRRFTLFSPDQLDNLYVGPIDHTPAGQAASLVDFHQPDFNKFPKFKQALTQAKTIDLCAGDALFIPSMWWHHVESFSPCNILINYWWRHVSHHHACPSDALSHALLSIKDLPQAQRDIWREIFDHYVFTQPNLDHIPKEKRGILNPITEDEARRARARLLKKLNR